MEGRDLQTIHLRGAGDERWPRNTPRSHFMSELLLSRRACVRGLLAAGTVGAFGGLVSAADDRLAAAVAGATRSRHALAPALRFASEALQQLEEVEDYTATFYKNERVRGVPVLQQMNLKVREKPFSVYLGFVKPHAGREVLYVAGQNGGNLLAHGTGIETLAGTLSLAPTSAKAMEESRYPVSVIGIRNMVNTLATRWQEELKYSDIRVKYYPNAKVDAVSCRVYETTHTRKRNGVKFYRNRLFVARESGIPVRAESFAWPASTGSRPPLEEQYTYMNTKTNVGLSDIDFSKTNPRYAFP